MPKLDIDETSDLLDNIVSKLSGRDNLHYDALFNYHTFSGILRRNRAIHLAILIEPYLSLILKGEKTIESRFTKNRIAPFGQAKSGDIILLKKPGGGIVGVAEIEIAAFHHLSRYVWVNPQRITTAMIKRDLNDKICATPEFWGSKKDANYASILWLKNVVTLSEPIPFKQSDRSAWIVLS